MKPFYTARDLLFRYLDESGNGQGNNNANGDYSSNRTDFFYTHESRISVIHRMLISVEDTKGMTPEEYGNTGSALTNGILLLLTDRQNNVLCNLSDNDPVKSNAHWGRHCYDIDVKSWGNTPTNELLVGRWTFERCGQPVVLQPDEKIKIVLNDDLTGLIAHHFQIQGYWLSNQDPTPRVTKSNFT